MVLVAVQVIDHGRQGGGLAGTGRPGHQHQPARRFGHFAKHLAHPQVFHGQDFRRNGPKHRPRTAILVEGVDPEPCDARNIEGKIGLQKLFVIYSLPVVHDVVDQFMNLLVVQRWQVDAPDIAIDADHRRQPGGQVQVRRALLGAERQ
ncbi:hypothetical protein D3C78_1414940 [compost metagenome]